MSTGYHRTAYPIPGPTGKPDTAGLERRIRDLEERAQAVTERVAHGLPPQAVPRSAVGVNAACAQLANAAADLSFATGAGWAVATGLEFTLNVTGRPLLLGFAGIANGFSTTSFQFELRVDGLELTGVSGGGGFFGFQEFGGGTSDVGLVQIVNVPGASTIAPGPRLFALYAQAVGGAGSATLFCTGGSIAQIWGVEL